MLKASSFLSFSKAHFTLTEKIAPKLLKTYQCKPQKENTTLEFFLDINGDFTTIHTKTYIIRQGEIEKGEFVIKWIVSLQNGDWSFVIKIPAIDLKTSCSLEEQQQIYEGFSTAEEPPLS